MLYGYARVSTFNQTVEPQALALREAGVHPSNILAEVVSGGMPALKRQGLATLVAGLQPDDVLAVARLDRLGRNPADVLSLLELLEERRVGVRLLDMGADTGTPAGRLVVGVLAAVAGWERDIIRARTRDGLTAARARGSRLGRPAALTEFQRREAVRMKGEGHSVGGVAALLGCSWSVAQRAMSGT